jgi:hypothetical protein
MTTKFALYDFNGNPTAHYVVDEIEVPKPALEATVSHHIVIVDRSGSMYSVMDDTKAMIEKVMTVEEFKNSEMLLTLISYSSHGDWATHFARVPVAQVLVPNSPHLASIRSIRATCLTSVSGALSAALTHVDPSETTAISVHTDGYFNDRSPAAEAKAVDAWIKDVLANHPNVYANTIAYGNWTDFKMLDRISSSLSGKTVVARNVKQVYAALHDTSAVLAGRVLPVIRVAAEEDAFLAFHNVTQKKVNGSTTDFAVKGVGPDDVTRLYRFRKVALKTWARAKVKENADLTPAYVFARTALAQGRLNDAKFALIGTRDAILVRTHYKALTASALASFATDLEGRIAGDTTDYTPLAKPGIGVSGTSILDLCGILERHTGGYTVDLPAFLKEYNRRGVARLDGSWADDGTFQPAHTSLVPTDDPRTVTVIAFELNNSNATINMQIARPAVLRVGGEEVPVVAGKKLDLSEIRSYTIVGDGEVNVGVLPICISSKRLHADLVRAGVLAAGTFDPESTVGLLLGKMPVCSFTQTVDIPGAFNRLVDLTIQRGIFNACLAGDADATPWTEDQVLALKAVNISGGLNYNPPTTNPYRNLTDAITAGEVDSYTKYNVTLGDSRMVSVSALYSANEYLARRFSVKVPGAPDEVLDKEGFLKKPKFADLRVGTATVSPKVLSARTKLNAIDDLMYPIFTRFITGDGIDGLTVKSPAEEIVKALSVVEDEIEKIYAEEIRPMAFYVGATGLVPENWNVEVMDVEALEARFPGIEVEKKQREGTFLVSGTVVVGIFPEVAYFSTEKGMDVVRALRAV